MKATAVAPANIAFIKFFGKTDEGLRLPVNSSISMCLSNAITTTTVEFFSIYKKDLVEIKGEKFKQEEKERITFHLDRIRKMAKVKDFARIVTQNSFPKGSGIASSASGFAALTLATASAVGLNLSEKELSILSRLASGSACRSIPDGFVEWKKGTTSESSYAYSLYPPEYWDICDILLVVTDKPKQTTSTDAHKLAPTSPFYRQRIFGIEEKIDRLKWALSKKDLSQFGEIVETEALNMHAVMMTAAPPLFYWTDKTVKLMLLVWKWRKEGLPVYFTIDAGPSLHLICEGEKVKNVISHIKKIKEIEQVIVNRPSRGARLVNKHLF